MTREFETGKLNVAFTGTRKGMSNRQESQLEFLLQMMAADLHRFYHGDAVGADQQAARLVNALGFVHGIVRALPANGEPLKRNRDMVALVELVIAAPFTDREELRSGTWATVRYARERGLPVIMLSR